MTHSTRIAQLGEEIFNENSETAELLAGISAEQLQILETVQNEALEEGDLNNLIEQQRGLIQQNEQGIADANQALQYRQNIENGHLEQLQQEQQARQRIIDQTTEQAKRQQLLSQAVSGLMTVISLMTTLSG